MTDRPLSQIETWIFDLDNTLYPASCRLFDQVEARMTRFIMARFDLPHDAARDRQKDYFRDYGTTLAGLMAADGVDPHDFLDYVHAIDLSELPADPVLAAALDRLPGRKFVYTNGSAAHAGRVLDHLGLAPAFSGVFDIVAADFAAKPAPQAYRALVDRFAVAPARAAMIDDIARNLAPAAALGMTTVWMRHNAEWARAPAETDHIHYVIDDLGRFLSEAAPDRERG